MASAQAGALGEPRDTQIGRRVRRDSALHGLQNGATLRGQFVVAAELQLPAGAFEVHHQLAGDFYAGRPAEIFLHKRQRQVQSGGDTSGGANSSVTNMDGIFLDHDVRKALCQKPRAVPVSGDSFAAQEAGTSEHKSACTDSYRFPRVRP